MTDVNRNYDKAIIAEAARQRSHDLARAEIEKQREANRLREERLNKQSRRGFYGGILGALAGLTFLAIIVVPVYLDSKTKHDQEERERIRIQQIAELCIREGNIWVDGDCLLTKKESQ